MKKYFKTFYRKNKITLWLIASSIIGIILTILFMGIFIVNKPEAIITFLEKETITQEILPFSTLSFIGILLGLILIFSVLFLIVKSIFPSKKTLSNIIMKDEVEFLIDLPSRIGKEVFKNGK